MARSLNKVQLIGNLTRDPELRYTPSGTAVCTFGLATNRSWTTDTGEKHEETEFHNIVSWNKLAELCSQFLVKGRKVYLEGRLATRSWQGQDGAQRTRTEVVIDDMILLDNKFVNTKADAESAPVAAPAAVPVVPQTQPISAKSKKTTTEAASAKGSSEPKEEKVDETVEKHQDTDVPPDDIPF
jgi:single-strand DNA-binding protein